MNDEAVEDTFVWSSGEAVLFTNWGPGEPNDAAGAEDYVAMNWHFNSRYGGTFGNWNDTALDGTRGVGGTSDGPYFGLVETAASVPEPATLMLCGTGLVAVARDSGSAQSRRLHMSSRPRRFCPQRVASTPEKSPAAR